VIDSRVVPGIGTEVRPFGNEVNDVVKKLNAARTAVYPIDARGLSVDPGAYINIESLKELAERTGGRAWYNRNDLGAGVQTAIQELHRAYAIGFYLSEAAAAAGAHRLRIRTRHPGIRLSYQETYHDVARSSGEQWLNAIRFPVTVTDIPFEVRAEHEARKLSLNIRVQLRHVTLAPEGVRWKRELLLMTRFPGVQSVDQAVRSGETLQLALLPQTRERILRDGLVVRKTVAVPDGARELQVVLFDSASGKTGSLLIPLGDNGAARSAQ